MKSHNWIPRPHSFKPLVLSSLPDTNVASLITPERAWNVTMLNSLFYPLDEKQIPSIPLSYSAREDSDYWFYEKKGDFSVKSAYKLALTLQNADKA